MAKILHFSWTLSYKHFPIYSLNVQDLFFNLKLKISEKYNFYLINMNDHENDNGGKMFTNFGNGQNGTELQAIVWGCHQVGL